MSGRPSLNKLREMSTPYLSMKFPSALRDTITVHVDQRTTRECYATSLHIKHSLLNIELIYPSKSMVGLVDVEPRINDDTQVQ